ncbi:MAG: hypothetical protein HPY59_01775 [Anaerolineae bacterium]|nr:hypothetical protein [Anaerolineae bacterium]
MTRLAPDPALSTSNQSAKPDRPYSVRRIRFGLTTTLIGFAIFLLGTKPSVFGLDRSPIIGFVQIAVFIVGLAVICLGGYISLMALWNRQSPSIAADFGQRMVATGFVVAVFTGMADVFGFGSHPLPGVPFFGSWQARGVMIGEALIAIGFLLLVPYGQHKPAEENPAAPPPPSAPQSESD